ncbi:helix-turn-helix transcriptional regulator [Flavobacterium selenitireducens]|uniref:helix-turn-helix transcriptional regulator n=1 Tax=Flavobacterium selenitireducens TaxID=2722704 RepID=UPI00168AD513|nr:helix-turn-helix transcriptional regulator [Flavobacterium selenitireducens]MBD3581750.1 helix-turn-helix transcriptional regulator [Flavobacterium selenitireducens]
MFGKNIKKIRSVHGLSQQQFAEMFDLKRATLGAYEEGRSNPKMDTVIKIANHFTLDIEELLTKELTVNRLLRFNETITTSSVKSQDSVFEGIPCVTKENKDAFLDSLISPTRIALPMIFLPFTTPTDKTAFVVEDATMSAGPLPLLPKDTVIGEKVELNDLGMASGKLAVVATKGQLLLRKMTVSGNSVALQASQPGIDAIEIPMSSLSAVWLVRHVFHYNLPSENEVEKRLAALEDALANLAGKR